MPRSAKSRAKAVANYDHLLGGIAAVLADARRAGLSRDTARMLGRGAKKHPGDLLAADEALKAPLVLEFMDLKDYPANAGRRAPTNRCTISPAPTMAAIRPPNGRTPKTTLARPATISRMAKTSVLATVR